MLTCVLNQLVKIMQLIRHKNRRVEQESRPKIIQAGKCKEAKTVFKYKGEKI